MSNSIDTPRKVKGSVFERLSENVQRIIEELGGRAYLYVQEQRDLDDENERRRRLLTNSNKSVLGTPKPRR